MSTGERDEEIWRLRKEGTTLSQIGKQFDISSDRVRQICSKEKARSVHAGKWPPLRRELPMRIQNALIKTFGSDEIFNHPETLASLGEEVFITWRNIYRKSAKDLIDVLETMGYSVNRNMGMADIKCQSYLKIGRSILRKYFDYYRENSLDDKEYIPVVRLIIEGITKEMESSGMGKTNCAEVAEKLKAFTRSLYQNIWIEHAKRDEDPEEEPLDLAKEYQMAEYTFDHIYAHGEHPE